MHYDVCIMCVKHVLTVVGNMKTDERSLKLNCSDANYNLPLLQSIS